MKTKLNIIILLCSVVAHGQDLSKNDSSAVKNSFDTISKNLISSFNSILIDSVKFDTISSDKEGDWKDLKENSRKLDVDGLIVVGQDYGLITGYIDHTNSNNLNVLRSNGDLNMSYMGLPVNFSYNYSTLRNPLGANNYFRFSLDTEALAMKKEEKKVEKIGDLDAKIAEIGAKKGELKGKLGYGEVVISMLKKKSETEKRKLAEKQKRIESNARSKADVPYNDSLTNHQDLSLLEERDSLEAKYQQSLLLYDSIVKLYEKVQDTYRIYSNLENQLIKRKAQLNGTDFSKGKVGEVLSDSLGNRKNSFLSSIKTLDIGLTYPNVSGLSKNSPPIKGLNFEVEHRNWYYSIAAGLTLNNTMVSTDVIDNKLIYSENLFNQFDFQKVRENGFLIATKTGYGKVENSHAHIGFRYLTNSRFSDDINSDSLQIPSIGLELDLKWIPMFSQNTNVDVIYGKTSSSNTVVSGLRSSAWNSLFSGDRTNTGLLAITQKFLKIKTDVSGSIRVIDPLADMRSLGVLQPNNIRYELKSNHHISSRINLGLNYRHDRNNIDNKRDTTANLNLVGMQIGGQFGNIISYSSSINYLIQRTNNKYDNTSSVMDNYILGLSASAKYTVYKVENLVGINYNEFVLTNNESTGRYSSFGVQNSTVFNKSTNNFSINYFMADAVDSLSTNSLMIGDEFSITKKKIKYTVGAKVAISREFGNSVGGKLECLAQLTDFMDLLVRAERFVLGDFYNSYDRTRFNRFPYLITVQLNFKIK